MAQICTLQQHLHMQDTHKLEQACKPQDQHQHGLDSIKTVLCEVVREIASKAIAAYAAFSLMLLSDVPNCMLLQTLAQLHSVVQTLCYMRPTPVLAICNCLLLPLSCYIRLTCKFRLLLSVSSSTALVLGVGGNDTLMMLRLLLPLCSEVCALLLLLRPWLPPLIRRLLLWFSFDWNMPCMAKCCFMSVARTISIISLRKPSYSSTTYCHCAMSKSSATLIHDLIQE